MSEDAAQVMWADDYESLRARASAHLRSVGTGDVGPTGPNRHVRVLSRSANKPASAMVASSADPAPAPTVAHASTRRVSAPRSYGSRTGKAARPRIADSAAPRPRRVSGEHVGERHTAVVGGQTTPRRRRSPAVTRVAAEPDRTALWAVLLGVFLALIAVATAHSAPLSHTPVPAPAHVAQLAR